MIPVKIIVIIILISAVTKVGHPFRAAIVLSAITTAFALAGGAAPLAVAIQAVVSLAVGSLVFWLIDRTESIFLSVVVMVAGIMALLLFG